MWLYEIKLPYSLTTTPKQLLYNTEQLKIGISLAYVKQIA